MRLSHGAAVRRLRWRFLSCHAGRPLPNETVQLEGLIERASQLVLQDEKEPAQHDDEEPFYEGLFLKTLFQRMENFYSNK